MVHMGELLTLFQMRLAIPAVDGGRRSRTTRKSAYDKSELIEKGGSLGDSLARSREKGRAVG